MTVEVAAPQRTPHDAWLDRRWRLVGLLLAATALATAALMVAAGEKRSELGDLVGAVARGEVTEVRVVGLDDDREWAGYTTVELHWSGRVDRWTEVVVVRGGDGPSPASGEVVMDGDPRDVLLALDPDIVLTSGGEGDAYSSFAGWRVEGPGAFVGLFAWLGTLLLVVGGPEPWRATRWAWGWTILLGGPLGGVAYLLLGGPLGVWRPHPGHRRLTGGWAFLLAWFVFAGYRGDNAW
ncbi:hypothetical protein AAII07_01765 [Microvirga sp. 0TCS3.31]